MESCHQVFDRRLLLGGVERGSFVGRENVTAALWRVRLRGRRRIQVDTAEARRSGRWLVRESCPLG